MHVRCWLKNGEQETGLNYNILMLRGGRERLDYRVGLDVDWLLKACTRPECGRRIQVSLCHEACRNVLMHCFSYVLQVLLLWALLVLVWGCRPFRLQLSCPRSADTAMWPNLCSLRNPVLVYENLQLHALFWIEGICNSLSRLPQVNDWEQS